MDLDLFYKLDTDTLTITEKRWKLDECRGREMKRDVSAGGTCPKVQILVVVAIIQVENFED